MGVSMSTRSTISIQNEDGTVLTVYCHFDGYPEHNGRILLDHYNDEKLARELISFGDMSYLRERCIPNGKHSYSSPEEGVTVYYGRDRGEKDTAPVLSASWADAPTSQPYNYIFIPGEGWKMGRMLRDIFD